MEFSELLYDFDHIVPKLEFSDFLSNVRCYVSLIKELKKHNIKTNSINDPELSMVSGSYDPVIDRIYITFNKYYSVDELKYELLITLCHELVHQRQFYYRDYEYIIHKSTGNSLYDYLSHPDEIEAYAHDIYLQVNFLHLDQNLESNQQFKEYLLIFKSKSNVIKSLIKHYNRWIHRY